MAVTIQTKLAKTVVTLANGQKIGFLGAGGAGGGGPKLGAIIIQELASEFMAISFGWNCGAGCLGASQRTWASGARSSKLATSWAFIVSIL